LLVKELRKKREKNASDELKIVMDDTLKVFIDILTHVVNIYVIFLVLIF
jgi:hypothetical protein